MDESKLMEELVIPKFADEHPKIMFLARFRSTFGDLERPGLVHLVLSMSRFFSSKQVCSYASLKKISLFFKSQATTCPRKKKKKSI